MKNNSDKVLDIARSVGGWQRGERITNYHVENADSLWTGERDYHEGYAYYTDGKIKALIKPIVSECTVKAQKKRDACFIGVAGYKPSNEKTDLYFAGYMLCIGGDESGFPIRSEDFNVNFDMSRHIHRMSDPEATVMADNHRRFYPDSNEGYPIERFNALKELYKRIEASLQKRN